MSWASSANRVLPRDGRTRLSADPACRDVGAARAPPYPDVSPSSGC